MSLLTPARSLGIAALLLALGFPLVQLFAGFTAPGARLPIVHVGIPRQPGNAAWFLALDRGLFKAEGIDVVEHPYDIGLQAQQALIDGEVDLAIVADTPFILAILAGEDLSLVATSYDSRNTLAISARRAAGIGAPQGLRGCRLGYVPGTNSHYFLDSFLLTHGLTREDLELVPLAPEELVPKLSDGSVDAIASWEPLRAQLREAMGDGLVEFSGAELYAFRFGLAGRSAYVASKTAELVALLRALQIASDLLAADPEAAARLTSRHLGVAVKGPLDPLEFRIKLDQGLVVALEDQARWAVQAGLAPQQHRLNVLRHIAPAPLLTAAPLRVTLVH